MNQLFFSYFPYNEENKMNIYFVKKQKVEVYPFSLFSVSTSFSFLYVNERGREELSIAILSLGLVIVA